MMTDLPDGQLDLHGVDPLHGKSFVVRKRDGRAEEFNEARIHLAIESAFKAVEGVKADDKLREASQLAVKKTAEAVVTRVLGEAVKGEKLEVEKIQDAVETQLLLDGHLAVVRRYILYREDRRRARAAKKGRKTKAEAEPAVVAPQTDPKRLLLEGIYRQALPEMRDNEEREAVYRRHFNFFINEGDYLRLLTPELLTFDLDRLAEGLRMERDELFPMGGLQVLCNQYLLHENDRCIETPQFFWMRVAMGLALNEGEKNEARALEFYHALSTFRFVPSAQILLNAGRLRPQFGVAPVAVAGMDVWQIGIESFLVGTDEASKRVCRIPDLFIQRVRQKKHWTLFHPGESPELRHVHGKDFEELYLQCEAQAEQGDVLVFKRLEAVQIWDQIVVAISAGQVTVEFSDAAHARWPHAEPVFDMGFRGAINLAAHIKNEELDALAVGRTTATAMRLLDNAIEVSCYANTEVQAATHEHRAVGLGLMGFQDALDKLEINYAGEEAAQFADASMEMISYYAILASTGLALERGAYPAYRASKWNDGNLPVDSLAFLATARGGDLEMDPSVLRTWTIAKEMIKRHGMRNSHVIAVGPTAELSVLTGVSDSIAPTREIEAVCLIECASRRQKWIDLEQVMLLPNDPDPAKISELCLLAWRKGLKTGYETRVRPERLEEEKVVEEMELVGA